MYSFLQTPSLDVIGQEILIVKLGVAVLVHSHVEYLKEPVMMMMSVLAIYYVEQTTASLNFIGMLNAAMIPFQVSKEFAVINQIYLSHCEFWLRM